MKGLLFSRLQCPATDVAATDATVKGATDAAATVGADSLGGAAALDAGSALAAGGADAALAGGTSILPSVLGGAGDAASVAPLEEITVTGTPAAAASSAAPGLSNFTMPGMFSVPVAGVGAGPQGAAPAGTAAPQDVSGGAPALDPGFVGLGGEDVPLPTGADLGGGGFPIPDSGVPDAGYTNPDSAAPDTGGGFWDWLKQPKNALTAAQLGLTGISALRAAQLPGTAKTAAGIASPLAKQAETVINTGGQGSPLWAAQKFAIDASIDQQIKDATASMEQTLANAGGGGKDSGIVQQQIAGIKSRLETERQDLYRQQLQANVQAAVSELTGADSTLLQVAQLQMSEDELALKLVTAGATLAARLQQLESPT